MHRAWGLSDSSEHFVFLSGLMLSSVFALKTARQGWVAASRDLLVRTWRLSSTNAIVFALWPNRGREPPVRRGVAVSAA